MGSWGVKSYENDVAADAIDAGLERVHGAAYDDVMDDRNPFTFDQAQESLADPATLAASMAALREAVGPEVSWDDYDEYERLAFVGIVVRHAEFGVPIPIEWRERALEWLEHETIDWEDATVRRLRRQKEIARLRSLRDSQTLGT